MFTAQTNHCPTYKCANAPPTSPPYLQWAEPGGGIAGGAFHCSGVGRVGGASAPSICYHFGLKFVDLNHPVCLDVYLTFATHTFEKLFLKFRCEIFFSSFYSTFDKSSAVSVLVRVIIPNGQISAEFILVTEAFENNKSIIRCCSYLRAREHATEKNEFHLNHDAECFLTFRIPLLYFGHL